VSVYLDASAVVKLVAEEPGHEKLRDLLRSPIASSELLRAEVPRAIRRLAEDEPATVTSRLFDQAARWLDAMALIGISRELLDIAGSLESPGLRTLDAIHIASALSIVSEVEAFITYDRRQANAASQAGLPVVVPE
jgi:uncharacterized protein